MSAGSGSPEERLAALGLALPSVTPPLAAYVPAVRTGAYVYTSGQLPLVDGKLRTAGELYEFMVNEFREARAFTMELLVVIILVIELLKIFLGK